MSESPVRVFRHYVDGGYGQMHVRLASPGQPSRRPLLCFHLSPVSGVIYEGWLGEMGSDRLALAPDTPGYGMSDPPDEPPAIADFARAMGDVMDALEIEEADVMGYHTGSKICVELSRQRPGQIQHLVLVSAPVYTDEELAMQYKAMGHVLEPKPDGSHLVSMWEGMWQFRGPDQGADDLMKKFPDVIRGGERRPWGHRAAFSYQYPDALPEVEQPILVLNPRDDLWDFTPRISRYLRNGRVLDLPEWGHGFLDVNTREAGKIVREFLDS